MFKTPAIEIGTSGVEMRNNSLFLRTDRAAFAKNLTFNEGTIEVRPDIVFHDLNLQGQFQGGNYFTPSMGLSATSYSKEASALVNVVGGEVHMNPIKETCIGAPIKLKGVKFEGDTYTFGSENFLVVVNKQGDTAWWENGTSLVRSMGISDPSDENSHDTLDDEDARNWLPHNATIGHYIHARNHISVDFNEINSELFVSDILTKRGPDVNNDILKMEEACLDSAGGALVAPSRLGKTVSLQTLLTGNDNGEGLLVDFRECGVVTHDTLQTPRETTIDGEGNIIAQGWDEKRITTVRLQFISTVSRYAAYQLPDDIWFRSEFGFHFLKKAFGTGTIKDETLNHESHDIQPLIDMDECSDLSGASTGHWLKGSRFMGTVGFIKDDKFSSSSMGRGIAVMNQATTFTEDDTPRPQWEGVWTPDSNMQGIHKFTKAGRKSKSESFGFIASDTHRSLFYGEFQRTNTGCDVRSGQVIPIEWDYVTGAFSLSGIETVNAIRSGLIDLEIDESTGPISISIRTDENDCWELWYEISKSVNQRSLLSLSFGEPPRTHREATWFQFRIEGVGYVGIRTLTIQASKIEEKNDRRNHCVPICSTCEDYF